MERTLYNTFLSGVGLDGTSFFYVNPLQVRQPIARSPWYDCACCPPNVMRLLASLEHYFATTTGRGVQLHQYASGTVRIEIGPADALELAVETDYPYGGTVALRTVAAPSGAVEVAARVPSWASTVVSTLNARPVSLEPGNDGYLRLSREWSVGDEFVIEFPMRSRLVRAANEVDGARGCVAFERGPLVYCLEGLEIPGGRGLRGVSVNTGVAPEEEANVEISGETVIALLLSGLSRTTPPVGWPYRYGDTKDDVIPRGKAAATALQLRAVPYYAWANRGTTDMRVWIPADCS
jgi:hypothetical protein